MTFQEYIWNMPEGCEYCVQLQDGLDYNFYYMYGDHPVVMTKKEATVLSWQLAESTATKVVKVSRYCPSSDRDKIVIHAIISTCRSRRD